MRVSSERVRLQRPWPAQGSFVAMLIILLVGGCGGELQTPGEALRIFNSSLPRAFAGEQYSAPIRAVGGLRPFSFALEEGELPPGMELVNGTIRGVPTETGSYRFTVAVSDANLSRTFQEFTLAVVERPPPTLVLVLPETEVREPLRVRLQVRDAHELRAVSARITWDGERFGLVQASVAGTRRGAAALWHSEPGLLQIDLAALGESWNGELELAAFELEPLAPAVPEVQMAATLLDDRAGRYFQGRQAGEGGGPPAAGDPEAEEPDAAADEASEQAAGEAPDDETDGEPDALPDSESEADAEPGEAPAGESGQPDAPGGEQGQGQEEEP